MFLIPINIFFYIYKIGPCWHDKQSTNSAYAT